MQKVYMLVENGKTPDKGVWFDGSLEQYEDCFGGLGQLADNDVEKERIMCQDAIKENSYVVIYFTEKTSELEPSTTVVAEVRL